MSIFICAHIHNCEQRGVTVLTQRVCLCTNGGNVGKHAHRTDSKPLSSSCEVKKNEMVFVVMQNCTRSFFPLASRSYHVCLTTKQIGLHYIQILKTHWTPLKINVVAFSLIIRADFLFGDSYLAVCPGLCLQSGFHFGLFS